MKVIKNSLMVLFAIGLISCNKPADNAPAQEEAPDTTQVAKADETAEEKVDPATAAVYSMESDVYDFGDVQAGEKTTKTIEFTNTGKSPLVIKNAKASCGCTVPKYSKEPVLPGEKGTLDVTFKAPKTNGKQSKTVTLTTNTVKGRDVFRISANVVGGSEKKAPKPKPAPQQKLPAPQLESVN